ncbi:lytic transglycosylase domain-containing protein [Nocardioides sp.]|uniref:lytic transglycosylase domain-containing protein n=1 Tax=Nocardioides sp. TaxID=35761 RepID=UPI002735788C|nr:lytic transglycosylase domain-containing protein [Nocardioides sp.]MDP3893034.1 lytic transglycosylase domain-containing protein [Nocardioides sp.]
MSVVRGARRGVAVMIAACLLVSCSGEERAAPGEQPPAEQSPTERLSEPPTDAPAEELPEIPATDAATLAAQLDRAGEVLRARDAASDDVRRAAELHQLAVRSLASGRPGFRRQVLRSLHPRTARTVRGDIRAAELLQSMTDPQPRLPDWRIVEPPPPAELRAHYRRAQRRTGVDWTYLAAIHLVETRMGRIRGTSTAGAQGPMQFLPTTWDLYGEGGDINDPGDAILAAGRLLRAHGAPGDMDRALWHYNPSERYVGAVREYARTMQQMPAAYRGYWHWRVLYRHRSGTHVLPVGYPEEPAVPLPQD